MFSAMLTPRFELAQDDAAVTVTLHVPYVKASEADIHIDGDVFQCHIRPYFLRLHLPGRLVEDGRETARYNVAAGDLVVRVPKETFFDVFEDLDLHSKLLARRSPRAPPQPRAGIEVLASHDNDGTRSEGEGDEDDSEWELPQEEMPPPEKLLSGSGDPYGFAQQTRGFVAQLGDELIDVVLVPDADKMTAQERRALRVQQEDAKFNQEHYMADLVDTDTIHAVLTFTTKWQELHRRHRPVRPAASVPAPADDGHSLIARLKQASLAPSTTFKFALKVEPPRTAEPATAASAFKFVLPSGLPQPPSAPQPADAQGYVLTRDETEKLRDLPRREYLVDDPRSIYFGLVDLLFAYLYDLRTTEGEHTSESGWTINRLSATLSCLETYRSLRDVLVTCYRRALAYPLHRNWKLCVRVHRDVIEVLQLGRRAVLSCLLAMKHLLDRDEQRHYLCRLYVDDYCVWVQHASDARVASLADETARTRLGKGEIGWPLRALEAAIVDHEQS